VLVPLVMPWGYVFNHYLKAPGDPWKKQIASNPDRHRVSSEA
jgi:hypothetical protein